MSHFADPGRARANVLCLGTVWTFHLAVHPSPLASSAVIQMCENIDQNYSFCRGRPGESDSESVPIVTFHSMLYV